MSYQVVDIHKHQQIKKTSENVFKIQIYLFW